MITRIVPGLIALLAAGCSAPAVPLREATETVVEEQSLEQQLGLRQEDIADAVVAVLTELNYKNQFEQRMQSPEYQRNPFHVGNDSLAIEVSREQGLQHLQELAAEPILPFEGHYFFNGRTWINIGEHTGMKIQATGKLDPIVDIQTSTSTSFEGMARIARKYNEGLFVHYHPINAIFSIGLTVRARSFERLGIPLPPKHMNRDAVALPSADDVVMYTVIQTSHPNQRFTFCVCSPYARVFFSLDDKYNALLRNLPPSQMRERLFADGQRYQEMLRGLHRSHYSLPECIRQIERQLASTDTGFRFSVEGSTLPQ